MSILFTWFSSQVVTHPEWPVGDQPLWRPRDRTRGGVTQRHQRLASWPGTLTSKKTYIHTYIPLLTKATGMAETVLDFRHGLRTPDKAFFNNIPNFWVNGMGQIGWMNFGVFGVFSAKLLAPIFATVIKSLDHDFHHSVVHKTLFRPNPNISQILYWTKIIWEIAIVCPYSVSLGVYLFPGFS